MAVDGGYSQVTSFDQWYVDYNPTGGRDGGLDFRGMAPCADHCWRQWQFFKREMDLRVANYELLETLAAGEVISPKPDLPNVSSGETAGIVRRVARNCVQNTPNVDVLSVFDDDSVHGIFSRHILLSKIIGSESYDNDMQQNLFASCKTALTLGFSCVIPVLLQDAGGGWYIKYDAIHYRDVFPENGCKDIRTATTVYVRRYLTVGEVKQLVADNTPGWDIAALKVLLANRPPSREMQSVDHATKKHHQIPEGYEIITRYSSSGDPFLTFSGNTKLLLRIEKNNHPLKQHPVHFLVLEKDDQHPLGQSQVELLIGRQDFQDLMLNGAMKLWYRNINPSIIGYGTVNSIPNLSPGKYTQIANPNAKLEPFEVNTQTLMQYNSISQNNLGSMISLIGAADQQMAMQSGTGMSATPQGVEAQQAMVDITTNNYQKAIEAFFGHYCSYALTIYFQELKAVKKVVPTADARIKMLDAGLDPSAFDEDGTLTIDFSDLAVEYWVRCVPGSLTELEDEKQLRILNQMFVPLSQAMPAIAATQNQQMLMQAAMAMKFIIGKQIELSGSESARDIMDLWMTGDTADVAGRDERIATLEQAVDSFNEHEAELETTSGAVAQLQGQVSMLTQNMQMLLEKLGVVEPASETASSTPEQAAPQPEEYATAAA